MPKPVAYKILSRTTALDLEGEVAGYLKNGWDLLGGVTASASQREDGSLFLICAQAVVRYEE